MMVVMVKLGVVIFDWVFNIWIVFVKYGYKVRVSIFLDCVFEKF